MAGSYLHATTDDGRLRSPENMSIATETGGDAYETIEEFYGMVWYLADRLAAATSTASADRIEEARQHYEQGIERSPGREDD